MKNNLELLLYSFDGKLNQEEQQQLDKALSASPGLRAERDKLLKMRKLIGGLKISEDPSFSDKVLQRLKNSPAKTQAAFSATVVSLFPRVAAACIVILLLALSIVYLSEGSYSTDALIGVDSFSLEDAYSLIDY